MKRTLGLGIGVALAASAAVAQPARDPRSPLPDLQRPIEPPPGGPELDASCGDADVFGGSEVERAGWCHARDGNWTSVRTLARRAIEADDGSIRGHYLMGLSQHLGEANLPKARFHLQRAETLMEARHGPWARDVPELSMLHQRILLELVYVHGEMDDHEGKIDYVERLKEHADADYSALAAWPLLKLGRFDEARRVVQQGLESEHGFIRSMARTALCAIESEMRNRSAAYAACRAAAEIHADNRGDGAVEYTNAGAAAEEMLRLDEAERLYLEATLRAPEGTVNPWSRIVQLYLREGRFAEALDAWRRLVAYRERRPNAHLGQQDEADAASIGASLLLLAGRTERAARVTRRLVERPDRKGTSSAAAEQAQAGLALLDHVAQRARAEELSEKASYGGWIDGLGLRRDAWAASYRSWASGRRALRILADRERLETTLRPETPGSIEAPVWLDPDVVALVGAGVALAAIASSRAEETLPPERSEPIFALLESEAHAVAGRLKAAGRQAEIALEGLTRADVLLRARAHLWAGAAAEGRGDTDRARAHLLRVLQDDPGLFRRSGRPIPVRIASPEGDAFLASVADGALTSRRFVDRPWGFELRLEPEGAVLLDDSLGTVRTVAWPRAEPNERPREHRRRCLDELHARLLAAPVDLSQSDVRSLDGTIGGGGDADSLLDGILQESR